MQFNAVSIQPGYGRHTCAITWNVPAAAQRGKVYIYRSISGLPPWQLIRDEGTPASVGYYVDRGEFILNTNLGAIHYRLLLELADGQQFDSPIISLNVTITPKEQVIVRDIMMAELRNMRGGNGEPVFIFAPLTHGLPAPGFDFETYQMRSTGMQVPGKESYGEAFVGGFGAPAVTWVMRMGSMTTGFVKDPDGGGTSDTQQVNGRMLAFPRPMPNYMVVFPRMDDRFVIGEVIQPFLFRSILPIGYEVTLSPIQKHDDRYLVPLPEMPPRMYQPL